MKTNQTIEAEQYLYNFLLLNKIGIYGCHEVTIGIQHPSKKGREIVDFLTYDTKNIFRAYEIKITKADLLSNAKLSFVGHYNYLVIPRELYDEIKDLKIIPSNIGLIIINEGIIRKAKRKTLTMSDNIKLLESLMRSLNRENIKNLSNF